MRGYILLFYLVIRWVTLLLFQKRPIVRYYLHYWRNEPLATGLEI